MESRVARTDRSPARLIPGGLKKKEKEGLIITKNRRIPRRRHVRIGNRTKKKGGNRRTRSSAGTRMWLQSSQLQRRANFCRRETTCLRNTLPLLKLGGNQFLERENSISA